MLKPAMLKPGSLKSNFIINLAGQVLPLLVGLITIPKLIAHLGVERFGALSIVWVLVGYFSLFDFGLSKTLTYLTAQHFPKKNWDEISKSFWSVTIMVLIFSFIGSICILSFRYFGLYQFVKATPGLLEEIQASLMPIALAIPIVSLMTSFRGILEADEKFLFINVLQILLGIYTFVSPLFLSSEQMNLFNIVLLIFIGRLGFALIHFLFILKQYPFLRKIKVFATRFEYLSALKYGGWLTVSNIVNPLMVYLDRFFLSLMVPTTSVTYYTTPYEMVSRLLIIPTSLSRAIFPRMSANPTPEQTNHIYKKSVLLTALIMGAICLSLALGANFILKIWLGGEFPEKSAMIMTVLALGVFVNSLAYTPYTHLQSIGRSDITTKLHLVELPVYFGLFYFLTSQFGILGAAMAWSLRFLIDAILLFLISARYRLS